MDFQLSDFTGVFAVSCRDAGYKIQLLVALVEDFQCLFFHFRFVGVLDQWICPYHAPAGEARPSMTIP